MPEEIITRDSAAFKELYRDIVKAIRAVDILIDTHRPTIGNELYLTSEEICSIFSISKRSLQNYRDKEDNEYYTRLFAKEQSYRSMLRILGIDGNGFSDRKFRNVRHRYESTGFLQSFRGFTKQCCNLISYGVVFL